MNLSTSSVLLTVEGKIPVVMEIDGPRYRGRLVQALAVDAEVTAHAIELTETLQTERA